MAYKFYDTPMNGASAYYIRLGYEVVSQSLENNTSTVKYVMYIGFNRNGTGIYNLAGDSTVRLTVNGTHKRNDKTTFDFRGTTNSYTITEGTETIQHDSNGKAGLNLTGYWDPALSGFLKIRATTATISVDLPDLANAKGFTLERSTMNFGASQPITINGHSDGYSYDIKMTHGRSVYTMGTTSTGSFRLSVGSKFLTIVPNSTEATVTITVVTKLGGKVLGEESRNLTLVVPAYYRPDPPTIRISNLDREAVQRFNSDSYYLNQTSRMDVRLIPQGNLWGSKIIGFETRVAGLPHNVTSSASAMIVMGAFTFHSGDIKAYQIQGRVRDSRGRYSSWVSSSYFYVLDYKAPKLIDIQAERSGDGSTVAIKRTYEVAPLTISGTNYNSASLSFQTRKTGTTTWINNTGAKSTVMRLTDSLALLSGAFNPTESYEVKAILKDDFTTVETVVPLSTEDVPLDISKDGIGVGKIHELNKATLQVKGGRRTQGQPPAIETMGDLVVNGDVFVQFNGQTMPIASIVQYIVSEMMRQ